VRLCAFLTWIPAIVLRLSYAEEEARVQKTLRHIVSRY